MPVQAALAQSKFSSLFLENRRKTLKSSTLKGPIYRFWVEGLLYSRFAVE